MLGTRSNSCEPSVRSSLPVYSGFNLGASYNDRQLQIWELEAGQYSIAISDADSLTTVTKERFYRYDIDPPGTSYDCIDGPDVDLSDLDILAYTLPEESEPRLQQRSLRVFSAWTTPINLLSNTNNIINAWWCTTPCAPLDQCAPLFIDGTVVPGSLPQSLTGGSSGEFVIERDASLQTTFALWVEPQQP